MVTHHTAKPVVVVKERSLQLCEDGVYAPCTCCRAQTWCSMRSGAGSRALLAAASVPKHVSEPRACEAVPACSKGLPKANLVSSIQQSPSGCLLPWDPGPHDHAVGILGASAASASRCGVYVGRRLIWPKAGGPRRMHKYIALQYLGCQETDVHHISL